MRACPRECGVWSFTVPVGIVTAPDHRDRTGVIVKIPLELKPAADAAAGTVEYRWDRDTEILSAQVSPRTTGSGMSGSVGGEGSDGSWLIFDVSEGRINGIEVAV